MGNISIYVKISEKVKELKGTGLDHQAAMRVAKEMYFKKAQCLATKQGKEHRK